VELHEFRAVVEEARRAKPKLFVMSSPDAPASPAQIAEVEQRLGLRLPQTYSEFLREFGGGDFGLVSIYSVDASSDWYLPARVEESRRQMLANDLLPFADDGMGGFYAFEVRDRKASEKVFYWDHETGVSQPTEFSDIFEYLGRYAFEPA
jgi:hypothetical protein